MRDVDSEEVGPAAVTLPGLQLWVQGREFPDSQDEWDGNWLRIRLRCSNAGATVEVAGPLVDTVSFHRRMEGEAVLESVEPNIRVVVQAVDRVGHIQIAVHLTPDHLQQKHWFQLAADQTYLPPLIAQVDAVLREDPVREASRHGV